MKKLSRMPIEDLTEIFANAIRDAVWAHYTACHSVFGMEADGKIYRYYPDGDVLPLEGNNVKTIGTGDTAIDKDGAVELREDMIELRDEALAQGDMHWSVLLSHVVAFMANAIAIVWREAPTASPPFDPESLPHVLQEWQDYVDDEKLRAVLAAAAEQLRPSPATIVERMVTARETSHPVAYINKVEFDEPFAQAAVEKLRKDLAWKGHTGKQQAVVALPRELAEALLDAIGARKP